MGKRTLMNLLVTSLALCISVLSIAQNPINWTPKQLMAPSDLARAITTRKNIPVIICIGPGATIPHSIDVGMVNTKAGLDKLKTQLKNIPKNKRVVVYCGCCPYEHCPNVRPAINVLKEMKFTDFYLLDLPQNMKKNWIDKGYPISNS